MEYRVLARKYRPQIFADLIGQDVLVRTLTNAMASGRIHHAFVLTGIRGVGKTTTARIIARALNCIGADGKGGPTVTPCGACPNCRMIAEDRHPDVMEMDAASRTGVGDIRDLIDTVHYAPTSARYKIYIIDEVHMLSTSAFNALLKTLEEPPPHVKFIFATTEARKIPVTILSRCQRFDLKRVEQAELANHLKSIAGKEGYTLEDAALALLAQGAEGSVRDSLSLLDQAIARQQDAGKPISEAAIRDMMGLADKAQTIALLHAALKGEAGNVLTQFAALYAAGSDPLLVLQDMLEMVHFITRIKLSPQVANDVAYAQHERERCAELARDLPLPLLARLWQLLLKGISEVKYAPNPAQAAEMVLVRAAYMADLPTPAEVIAKGVQAPAAIPVPVAVPAAASAKAAASINSFADAVALLEREREAMTAGQLKQFASLVSFAPGQITVHMTSQPGNDFLNRASQALSRIAGAPWKFLPSSTPGESTIAAVEEARKTEAKKQAGSDPLVASVLEHFPGAQIVDVKEKEHV